MLFRSGNGNWEIGVMGTMNVAIDLNTMAVSYQFVGKPEEPEVETGLFLVGNINGWDIDSDAAALVKDGDTYQGTFEFPADADEPEYSFFRLYTQLGRWGAGSIGAGGEANVDVIFHLVQKNGI